MDEEDLVIKREEGEEEPTAKLPQNPQSAFMCFVGKSLALLDRYLLIHWSTNKS
jgi:hypothetical protein